MSHFSEEIIEMGESPMSESFGYLCKGCGTAIRGNYINGGEKAILIHVRHGIEIGRTEGHYGEYGNVIEDKIFRCDDDTDENQLNPNNHGEISKSEFRFPDSSCHSGRRLYYEDALTKDQVGMKIRSEAKRPIYKAQIKALLDQKNGLISEDEHRRIYDENLKTLKEIDSNFALVDRVWDTLEPVKDFAYSGIAAWHHKCYHEAPDEAKADLTPSFDDPNQSWGEVREEYE